jgi:DNA-binding response OmpR family regulator
MKSILLVDDEAMICVELQRTLEELGYQVETSHTVESALGSISDFRFDGMIVEFNLNSGNATDPRTGGGIRLISELRKSGIRIPILVYTSMDGHAYETASLDAGADHFALKKTPISDFFSSLDEHVIMRGATSVADPSNSVRKTPTRR